MMARGGARITRVFLPARLLVLMRNICKYGCPGQSSPETGVLLGKHADKYDNWSFATNRSGRKAHGFPRTGLQSTTNPTSG